MMTKKRELEESLDSLAILCEEGEGKKILSCRDTVFQLHKMIIGTFLPKTNKNKIIFFEFQEK